MTEQTGGVVGVKLPEVVDALWDRAAGVLPELLKARDAERAEAWHRRELEAVPQATTAQSLLTELLAAGKRLPVFRDLAEASWAIEDRAISRLTARHPIGSDHRELVRLMALSMASMLLEADAALAVAKQAPACLQLLLDTGVRRIAWSPDVGVCKTLMATSTGVEINGQLELDPYLRHPMSRGLLYAASTTRLLADFKDGLIGMGVPKDRIGILYSDKVECRYPSIAYGSTADYPLLLVTQSMLMSCTAREQRREPRLPNKPVISDLLLYRNRERLCIWDEAFSSSMAEAASRSQLTAAKGALTEPNFRQQLIREAEDNGVSLPLQNLDELVDGLGELVNELNEVVAIAEQEKPDPSSVKTIVIPAAISEHADQLKTIADILEKMDNAGIAAALESLADMTKAGGVEVSVLGSGPEAPDEKDKPGHGIHVVTPRVVISDRITRLIVLDANYEASLLAQMDPTVQLATGAEVFGRDLRPKVYDHVSIRWYAGHSGRRHRSNDGLDNKRIRQRVVTEQAQRAALVPQDERCLFVTFKSRKDGPDFTGEIIEALNTYCPSWCSQVLTPDGELKQRIEILTWGAHEGLNEFSDVGHVFVVGVMRRGWVTANAKGCMRSDVFARRRGDRQSIKEIDPNVLITNQVAGALIQALGRGRMRQTINGQAGQMVAHVPCREGVTPFSGKAPCKGSPLWLEFERRLRGVTMESASAPPPTSGMELVRTAAAQVLNGLPDQLDTITSRKLKELVLPLLPDGGANISDKVFKAGLTRLNEENTDRLQRGVPGWVKPDATARSWVRAGALPTSEA